MIEERILTMLKSTDEEIIELAIILIFSKGEDWIIENIPAFGLPGSGRYAIQLKINSKRGYYRRGNIYCCTRAGVLDMRYLTQFTDHKYKHREWIEL